MGQPRQPYRSILGWPTDSGITGMGGGVQVGWAVVNDIQRASLWSGTAGSWVDLHPPGNLDASIAYATDGTHQVGWLGTDACLWSGSASSWVDLDEFLPDPSHWESRATGVVTNGSTLMVVGYGGNSTTGRTEAILWVRSTVVPCPADCDANSSLNIDDFICFQTNFVLGDPAADCDASGALNIDDFICFQTLFALGC
jgi:hypothetical protein